MDSPPRLVFLTVVIRDYRSDARSRLWYIRIQTPGIRGRYTGYTRQRILTIKSLFGFVG
jgi:hypothetical protein